MTSPHEIQKDVSLEKDSLSSVLNSWMQDLLIRALEKEPISKTVSHCRHLFLYLNALKTELLSVPNSLGQQRLQSAMLLCFQLLQYLVQRSVVVQKNFNENKSNILEVERAGISSSTISSPTVVLELNSEVICRSVFHHPVLLNCFLWQPEQASSQAICKDLSVQLSYSTCNFLLAVLPSLTLQQKHTLMGPFLKKLSHVGRTEIQSAKEGNGRMQLHSFKDILFGNAFKDGKGGGACGSHLSHRSRCYGNQSLARSVCRERGSRRKGGKRKAPRARQISLFPCAFLRLPCRLILPS